MSDFGAAFGAAISLIANFESGLAEIVLLSLSVSLSAVAIASLIGLPVGAALGIFRFPGRTGFIVILNALMGLPPVVVGLTVYLILSRSGPLGTLGLLFTPTAMIIAQIILVAPIIAALARQIIEDLWIEYSEQLQSFGTGRRDTLLTLLWDSRFSLLTTILAGFGRASAEVGAVMFNDFVIVGPAADPAKIKGATVASEAYRKIAAAKSVFVSRGDDSGTHKKSLEIWRSAGVDAAQFSGKWYREAGAGMGATLNIAVSVGGYALTDRATWEKFGNKGGHVILSEGDPELRNQYGIIMVNPSMHGHVKKQAAQTFIDWVVSKTGQSAIDRYMVNGKQVFFANAGREQ